MLPIRPRAERWKIKKAKKYLFSLIIVVLLPEKLLDILLP